MSDYITGRADFGSGWNKRLLTQLSEAPADPGHDMFKYAPAAAAITGLIAAVRDAVTDLIGPARLDKCMHVHYNDSPEPGDWHVDDYCGDPWPSRKQFVIVCYFPQDTTLDMGPTAVRVNGVEHVAAGPAGTFLAMRHDVEHRATANTTGKPRLMLKFLYRQTTERSEPNE